MSALSNDPLSAPLAAAQASATPIRLRTEQRQAGIVAAALRLAQDGAAIIAHYSGSKDGAEEVVRQIKANGG